jgi:hypothetical protein
MDREKAIVPYKGKESGEVMTAKIKPWVLVSIGIGSFIVGMLVVTVICMGVYILSVRPSTNAAPVQYVYPQGYPQQNMQSTPYRVQTVIPQGGSPMGQSPQPVNSQPSPQVVAPLTQNQSLTTEGAAGIPPAQVISKVPDSYIMLKPAMPTSEAPRSYPVVPTQGTTAQQVYTQPYSPPAGVSLEPAR